MANRMLQSMVLNHHQYELILALDKLSLNDVEDYQIKLFQRNTENAIELPHTVVGEEDDYYLVKVMVDLTNVEEFFSRGDTFDLSITYTKDEEEEYRRIKSNYEDLEFQRVVLEENVIFYPASTKMGNISFYKREDFLLAKVHEVSLEDEAQLTIKGRICPPYGKTIENVVLEVNVKDEVAVSVPVDYQSDSFQSTIDLKSIMGVQARNNVKLYVTATDANGETIRSHRIKVHHVNQLFPIQTLYKHDGNKYKITIKPTKRSKYLSISVAHYQFVKELKRDIRKKWIRARRSKKLLKGFTFAFFVLGKILPVDKKLVIFESFHGKQYSDNPRAIYEYMQENNPEYKLIWSFDRRHIEKFDGINKVRRFSIRWLLLMSRANYWVTNARLPKWIPKPNHTKYLQTWHGTPLKRLATDMEEVHMPGTNTEKYKANFVAEAAKWDYLISPNNYSTKVFRRAFQFKGEMIESGYPRNDFLYKANNPAEIAALKEKLGISPEKKVILYAPTWRDNQFYQKGKYKFNLELNLNRMQEEFGEDYVIVLRLHYLVSENLDISEFEGFVYDFSNHEDIRDLYVMADMLITDYSSVFFDYANLKRPIFFFVYDIADYRDNLRGFYFDFEKKAPGPLTLTTEQLIEEIKRIEDNEYKFNEEFYNRFCYLEDGDAAKRVVERVFPQ